MLEKNTKLYIRKMEGIHLFHLIQQVTQEEPRKILSPGSIKTFMNLRKYDHPNKFLKMLREIDEEGKQMDEDYFGLCLSNMLAQVQVYGLKDLQIFHYCANQLLAGQYYPPFMDHELWDIDRPSDQIVDNNAAQAENILKNDPAIFNYQMEDKFSVLNNYLAIITLDTKYQTIIIEKYKYLLTINFIQTLQKMIRPQSKQIQVILYLKSLCYFYHSLKYKEIKQRINQVKKAQTFMYDSTNWKHFMHYYNFKSQNILIKYYTTVLASIISRHIPEFSFQIWKNKQFLGHMCSHIQNLGEFIGFYFGLQFLTNLVKNFPKLPTQWKQQNIQLVSNIYTFAISTIKQTKYSLKTRTMCIKLIKQIFLIYQPNKLQLLEFKSIISDIFQITIAAKQVKIQTLELLQQLISSQNEQLVKTILFEENFITFIKKSISQQEAKIHFKCYALHITYLLILNERYRGYFIQKDFIRIIMENSGDSYYSLTMTSEIILIFIERSYNQQWRIVYLYQSGIIDCLGYLLSQSLSQVFRKNYFQQNIIYFNNRLFINTIKSIFLLSNKDETHKERKVLFLQNITLSFVKNMSRGIDNLFLKQSQYLRLIVNLEIQININNYFKAKLYQLINILIDNICDGAQYKDKQILRQIVILKRKFYEQIYDIYPIYQLDAKRIPIYLKYFLYMDPPRYENIIRFVFGRVQWYSLKHYIIGRIKEEKKTDITDIVVTQFNFQNIVIDEKLLKQIIKSATQNYKNSKFEIHLVIKQVKVREINQNQTHLLNTINIMNNTARLGYGSQHIPNINRSRTPNYQARQTNTFREMPSRSPIRQTACPRCYQITSKPRFCETCNFHF